MGMDVLLFLFLTATPMKENTNLINDMALKYRWNDGRIYDGQFSEDKRHGKGMFTWPDGAVYDGDFVNGQRQGHGKNMFADGGQGTVRRVLERWATISRGMAKWNSTRTRYRDLSKWKYST